MEVTLTSDLDATGKSYSDMEKKGITVASKYEQQKSSAILMRIYQESVQN